MRRFGKGERVGEVWRVGVIGWGLDVLQGLWIGIPEKRDDWGRWELEKYGGRKTVKGS